MQKLKAPFNKYNPKLPKRQRTALAKAHKALAPTLRFFSFCVNSKGQVELHARTRHWGTYVSRSLLVGKRGGLIYRGRFTKLRAWLDK